MGITTFTGPVRAGDVLNTSGTTLGSDVQNVGTVVTVQAQAVTQAKSSESGAATGVYKTDIVIPANSLIVGITMLISSGWSGADKTFSIGVASAGTTIATGVDGTSTGVISCVTGATVATWKDVGTTDVRIWVSSVNTGTGVGTLVIQYVQAADLTP
ncbi:hypothetical protein UFOVP1518_1 [uncultured Caudovirales phage]|uniref:Uncharacterized protein n=1 Tax=uncultured Caudovirales phage TaxID=2100421 RepID=A0A6J5T444_9CAUD|nr:hypothetical protein UFOVP475_14 [uncultured Caudovirales phage]CAB4169520.1 hypothetical protein UFOVP897_44 [uncultured Caudovirales phage]CAB4175788.1 hypothetical protein UFOVP984_14 [uncultured Caudovirales phage]CAB4181733.1 hypothetical protein UFOVP1072_59 [uncultured Caudovirales phage]CAB4191212.1 hypothetical protein UFOVP1211_13 [uncultured Caudovirales phage]